MDERIIIATCTKILRRLGTIKVVRAGSDAFLIRMSSQEFFVNARACKHLTTGHKSLF